MIPLEAALQIIRDVLVAPRTKSARVPLREAQGRVLAADVVSPLDFPHFDRAAMDGWAIPAGGERRYRVVGVLHAGDTATIAAVTGDGAAPLAAGATMKVMTGAPVPPGTARVVPVELAREADGGVEITAAGDVEALPACIHERGQDVKRGEVVARAGERLTAVRLANLLSVGVETVSARKRARVTIAPTGDELVARAADLAPGRILDTNGPLLEMILRGAGCTAGAHVAIPDDPLGTKARLAGMLGQSDLVVLTGGVSEGDRDFVPDALRALDLIVHFDRVAVQPGKPTLFATGPRGVVFALPGNPVSAFVTAHLFVLPALALLEGAGEWPRFVTLPLAEAWSGRSRDRVRLYPARLTRDGGVRLLPYHGSGHLRALIEADGLVRIEPEWGGRVAEAPVQFWPLRVAAFGRGEGGETA